ncbi:hypothetical protein C2869_11725 [Saccharobesus litoralis]|uniref:Uncharacterized protein n=1 Tax=Saccharobesus litoralis TaxID=2172099 RepID=A0A2S0VS67_9ALTE|nr:SoxR reducing system RseC family protein [Saccharobesus litoralis]AWB67061.1 hypothetical protein C2869_11725 [Saccharobesus litoralis]
MLYENATFIERIDKHTIWVETQIKTSCNACQHNSECGTGVIAKSLTPKSNRVKALCSHTLAPKQQVVLQVSEQNMLAGAFVLYGLPLIMMILLMLAIEWLLQNELASIVAGFIGLALGLFMAKGISKKFNPYPQVVEQPNTSIFTCIEP